MGSTLTAVVIWNGHAFLAQVGDSRAYLFREGRLVQLTEDQTLVCELINQGSLTPEQAKVHPQRSVITQALGCTDPIRVALGKATLRRGDRLLLCTDGLHGELSDERISEILGMGQPAKETLERMLQEALDKGGRDNITALLMELSDPAFPLPVPGEAVKLVEPALPASAASAPLLSRIGRILGRTT
jgi:protein phosphatase